MKYPKNYLDEIKQRLKVSDVVSKSVSLKKRGKEFIGLSPFKNERTPSFTVNNEKGFYHCFSSGEHGNIFDFVMKTQGLDFGDTVRMLAHQAGMPQFKFTKKNKEQEERYSTYTKIYQVYNNKCHKALFQNPHVLDYLLNSRKLSKEIIEEFKLGYVPFKNDFSEKTFSEFSEKDLLNSGIFYKNEKTGKIVERFVERILFPIHNLTNDIVAYGGRTLNKNNFAKYINSPETEFYKKGLMLFNLQKAKQNKHRDSDVIIVEGYMDAVSLYDQGIKNVVSNQGTSITEGQINILWRYFANINICLDGDESGKQASNRIAEKFIPYISEQKKLFITELIENKDPDDYIKDYGKEEFLNALNRKLNVEDFIWNYNISKINFSDTYELSKFEKKIKQIYATIKDEVLNKYMNEKLAEKLTILAPNQKNYNKNYKKRDIKKNPFFLRDTQKIFQEKKELSRESILEINIIFIIMKYPEVINDNVDKIKSIKFLNKDFEDIKFYILNFIRNNYSKEELINSVKLNFMKIVENVEKKSSINSIMKNKNNDDEKKLLFNELVDDYIETIKNIDLKKIEENLTANLDETSFNQYLELKKQLNN